MVTCHTPFCRCAKINKAAGWRWILTTLQTAPARYSQQQPAMLLQCHSRSNIPAKTLHCASGGGACSDRRRMCWHHSGPGSNTSQNAQSQVVRRTAGDISHTAVHERWFHLHQVPLLPSATQAAAQPRSPAKAASKASSIATVLVGTVPAGSSSMMQTKTNL